MGLLLTGRQISAQEAYRLGVVNEVVTATELKSAVEPWVNDVLAGSPVSVRLTRASVMAGLHLSVEEAMQQDAPRMAQLYASADFVEGPKAFAEKRAPVWHGR